MYLSLLSTLTVIILTWNISGYSNKVVLMVTTIMSILYMKNPSPVPQKVIYFIFGILFIYIFWLCASIILHTYFNMEAIYVFMGHTFMRWYVFILLFFFYYRRKELLVKSIDNALILFVGVWFLQLTVYYISGEYLDFLKIFTGVEQRYQAYFMLPGGLDLIRPTSVFNEPGTYAMGTLPLLILSYLDKRKMTKLHLFILLSYFFSLSLFAMISASLFSLIVLTSKLKFDKKILMSKKFIFLVILLTAIILIVQSYLDFRFNSTVNNRQLDLRANVVSQWQFSREKEIILGQGVGQTVIPVGILADTSLLFKIIFEYGILSIPFFIFIFYFSWGLPAFFLLVILLTKMSYLYYVFWFYLAAVYIIDKEKENHC